MNHLLVNFLRYCLGSLHKTSHRPRQLHNELRATIFL
jgi:hypothetical protein